MNIKQTIEHVYNKLKKTKGGKNADYIPVLSKVNPSLYAISICTVDGDTYDIGDYNLEFPIESISKIFSLSLALEKYGTEYVKKIIGNKPSKFSFNSASAIENVAKHLSNSFSNAGAIATTCLSYEKKHHIHPEKLETKLLDNMSRFAGKKLHVNTKIYKSEISFVDHNYALAYLFKSYSRFQGDVPICLDIYTRQCSTEVTCQDISVMAATIANNGINPITQKVVMDKKHIPYIIDHMYKNGLYDQSEDFNMLAGIPCKSGVSGGMLIVIPGVMGIGIYSPPLNKYGNSFKGIKSAFMLADELNLKKKHVSFKY